MLIAWQVGLELLLVHILEAERAAAADVQPAARLVLQVLEGDATGAEEAADEVELREGGGREGSQVSLGMGNRGKILLCIKQSHWIKIRPQIAA